MENSLKDTISMTFYLTMQSDVIHHLYALTGLFANINMALNPL